MNKRLIGIIATLALVVGGAWFTLTNETRN